MTPHTPPPSRTQLVHVLILLCATVFSGLAFLYYTMDNLLDAQTFRRGIFLARTATDKDIILRKWLASTGGIFVPVTEATPPNPYLPLEGRDVYTPDGKHLTLMNPAYVTRLVHELWRQESDVTSRILSTNPVNPINMATEWEAGALALISRTGQEEFFEVLQEPDGSEVLQYIVPLKAATSCLKCHMSQGYQVGDIMGGISLTVPAADFQDGNSAIKSTLFWGFFTGGLFVLLLFVWGSRKLLRHIDAQTQAEEGLKVLASSLEEKVLERTLELQREKERVQTILSGTMECILEVDAENRISYVNRAALLQLGYKEKEIQGHNIFDVFTKEKEEQEHPISLVMQQGKPQVFSDLLVRRHNEEFFTATGSISPLLRNNTCFGCVLVFHAVTTLDTLEFLQKVIFTYSTDPFFLWEKNGNGVCNDAAVDFLGADSAELIMQDFLAYSPEYQNTELSSVAYANNFQLCDELGDIFFPWTFQHSNGTLIPCECRLIKLKHHLYEGYFGIIHDVSSITKEKEQAEDLAKAKSDFLALMSHEIRTPMTAILGLTHLALLENPTGSQKDFLMKIRRSSKSLLAIINDVLDFSKIEAGKLELVIAPFAVADVAHYVEDLFASSAQEKGLDFIIDIDPALPDYLVGDELRLGQIMMNYCSNAIKFTRQGAIRISIKKIREQGDTVLVRFAVQDTGIGVQEEEKALLFNRFSQASASTAHNFGGTGLGLTICKQLTELMRGEVGFVSTYGVGSIFFAVVPMQSVPENYEPLEPIAASQTAQLPEGIHILVAEDNEINQEVIDALLDNMGVAHSIASNGYEAVQRAEEGGIDLILMDIQMPEMDGIQATRILRAKGFTKPILAMTASVLEKEKQACLEAGMVAHIAKPINPQELQKQLAYWLGQEK